MTGSEAVGFVLWALIFYPVWSPRLRRKRKALAVSGNATHPGKSRRQTGPMWEQDAPMAECFDDETERGDDL